MPNWAYNNVFADDPVARNIIKTYCLDSYGNFTFNKLIPMPEVLRVIASPVRFITGPDDPLLKDRKLDSRYAHLQKEGLFVIKINAAAAATGFITKEFAEKLNEQYGACDWYDWATKNWGTKWDACNSSCDSDGTYRFETAWCEPYKFICKLAEKVPANSSIGWITTYEDGGSCEFSICGGKINVTIEDPLSDDDGAENDQ